MTTTWKTWPSLSFERWTYTRGLLHCIPLLGDAFLHFALGLFCNLAFAFGADYFSFANFAFHMSSLMLACLNSQALCVAHRHSATRQHMLVLAILSFVTLTFEIFSTDFMLCILLWFISAWGCWWSTRPSWIIGVFPTESWGVFLPVFFPLRLPPGDVKFPLVTAVALEVFLLSSYL